MMAEWNIYSAFFMGIAIGVSVARAIYIVKAEQEDQRKRGSASIIEEKQKRKDAS